LRSHLTKIIRRAGEEPWPKLFQNLRSTRETELARDYPINVVFEWIGNTAAIAAKHYLQVTDEDFERAAQKAAQQAQAGTGEHRQQPKMQKPQGPIALDVAAICSYLPGGQVGGTGLESLSHSAGITAGSRLGDARIGALAADSVPIDADLVTLESALRNGWAIPEDTLRQQLGRVQAVLDDPRSNDRARWRARRVLELAGGVSEST
jgi:hypothetical protein